MTLSILSRGTQCVKTGRFLMVYGKFTTRVPQLSHTQLWIQQEIFPLHYLQIRVLMKETNRIIPKHDSDGISKEYQPIYRSTSENYITYGMPVTVCLFSVLTVLCGSIVYNYYVSEKNPDHLKLGNFSLENTWIFVYFASFFLIVSGFYCSRLYRKAMLRIYHNPNTDQYIGIQYGFTGKKKFEFSASDVRFIGEADPHFKGNFEIKGKRYIINLQGFEKTNHYNRFVGYDTGATIPEQPIGFIQQYKLAKRQKPNIVVDKYSEKKKEIKKKTA